MMKDTSPSTPALAPGVADDATALRAALFELLAAGDQESLLSFCKAHAKEILQHFASWRATATSEASDPEQSERDVGNLYAIGKIFANHLGNGGPLAAIIDPSEQSDIAGWERTLAMAMNLIRQMQYEEANRLLSDQLIDSRDLKGHGHLHLSATTHWYLSQCNWLQADRNGAIAHGERSLNITRHIHDDPKYLDRYLRHLCTVHRYFGEAEAAAAYADQLHDFLTQNNETDEARYFRRQAQILRQGEPLTRVVAWIGTSCYELDELPADSKANMKLVLARNRSGFQVTDLLIQQAGARFNEGKFDQAAAIYRRAASADPYDPEPLVHLGRTQLFLGQLSDAIENFDRAEQLAPGFEFCRTGAWLARYLIPHPSPGAILMAIVNLATIAANAQEKVVKSAQAVADFPELALFRLEYGNNLKDAGNTADAEATYRQGLNSQGDDEVRTRLLLGLALLLPAGAERTSLLEQAVRLGGHPIAAATAQLFLRFGW
ncbi:MAG TPA: tetratricopeptide repeat protein [Tepidisphaeraceae bacterium]|nr:tetratricopeptide repeat protein [Tepidisphaeraceae bacterium]